MLHEFLSSNREEIVCRCRGKVAKRCTPQPTENELEYGIPIFLAQLTEMLWEESLGSSGENAALSSGITAPASAIGLRIGESAGCHGHELLLEGFTVHQVVLDYADLCQAVTELAIERRAAITVDESRALHKCLDVAVASAVSESARQHDRIIEDSSAQPVNQRSSVLADEFRNLITTAVLAVDAIKRGDVGISGATGGILDRSLTALQDLTNRAFDIAPEASLPQDHAPIPVREFIAEIQAPAAIKAKSRDLEFIVPVVELELVIDVDRARLAGAAANLLHNAFKFTKPHSRVSLTAFSAGDRVFIEVADECGGLPPGNPEDLLRPFEQRDGDQYGMGLGLSISRRDVEANGGRLHVRNIPGRGCVFTIDLPRAASSAIETKSAA